MKSERDSAGNWFGEFFAGFGGEILAEIAGQVLMAGLYWAGHLVMLLIEAILSL